ncbi:galectin-4-like [Sceloporus undulatus]|uniref:galectin-4-like n=1 Tax=Sceloporus undulatus TaxID=8520 RepID=UPI001C4C434E|nr:galectin-4-like [Sceloporus undulatus]
MAIEFETFKMPYYRAIPLGLDPESWVMLEGFIPRQSKGFYVDFAYGQFLGASIPLRFQLSFEGLHSSSTAVIALNTFTEGHWGKPNRVAAHLRRGQRFQVQFIVTSKGYKIIENDIFLCDFDHQLSPKRIRFLEMDGDIILENITFSWESSTRSRRLL